jgi:hypothetical protein
MKKNLALILFLLLSGVPAAFTQQSYIVTLTGDTLIGSVRIHEKFRTAETISFNQNGNETDYSSFQLKGFFDGNDHYEGAVVKIEKNSEGTNVEHKPTFLFYTDSVFLKVLVKGSKSLFFLRDGENRDHFYIGKDDGYELLLYKTYLRTDEDDRTYTASVKTYVEQLKSYLGDNQSIQKNIGNVEFKYNKLVDLFYRYYENKNARPIVAGSKEKARVELNAIAGASHTKTKLAGAEMTIMDQYTPSTDFTGGVSADIYLPGRLNLISVSNDFLYNSYDTRTSSRSNSTNYYVQSESHIVASYIKMYNQARYRFKINKAFVFLNAGLSHGLAINIEHTVVKETILNGMWCRGRMKTV